MTPRIPLMMVLTLGAFTLTSCDETITEPDAGATRPDAPAFATAANTWIARADMPSTERWGLATATVTNASGQSILYAVGGKTATSGSLSKVQAYNVATNTWSTRAPLPIPLFWTNGIGVIRGKLYISGGLSGYKEYQAVLLVYDPARNTWTQKRDMPNTSFQGVTGVINDKLYVLTGCDQEDCDSYEQVAFYRYDPAVDMWARLPSPTISHQGGMSGVIANKLYVTGGSGQLDVYDPATNRWTTKAPNPQPRWKGAGVHLGGKLYVIGGTRDGVAVRTTNVYDPATNTWTTKAPLPNARSDISARRVVLNGQQRIQLVGGRRPGNNLAYIP